MIEESEKKGTSGIKSHSGLIKNKVINLNVSSYIHRIDDFKLKLYANTTFWELKEIIAQKTSIAVDFLRIKVNQEFVSDSCNGKTIVELSVIFNLIISFFIFFIFELKIQIIVFYILKIDNQNFFILKNPIDNFTSKLKI